MKIKAVPSKSGHGSQELEKVIDQIGGFIEYWGFRKTEGMIWALIYISAKPLSGQEVADRLGFSKGMVSLAIHVLLDYGVIREVTKGAGRTVYYDTSEDLEEVIFNVLNIRERKMLNDISSSVSDLKKAVSNQSSDSTGISKDRVRSLLQLSKKGQGLLDIILKLGRLSD